MPLLFVFAMLLASTNSLAEPQIQELESIRLSVREFLDGHNQIPDVRVTIAVAELDRRLRLSRCTGPLQHFWPSSGRKVGNVTVGARCLRPQPWTIYVPAKVALLRPVVVLARALPRRTPLTRADLRVEERDVASLLSGYVPKPESAIGKTLVRSLPEGFVLNETLLRAPKLVRRGERVTLLAESNGIRVRSNGTALADGGKGDRVSVKNLRSRRIVEGVVLTRGTVQIRL